MGIIKEIILENGIRIIPKPDYVSYSDIQEWQVLNRSAKI